METFIAIADQLAVLANESEQVTANTTLSWFTSSYFPLALQDLKKTLQVMMYRLPAVEVIRRYDLVNVWEQRLLKDNYHRLFDFYTYKAGLAYYLAGTGRDPVQTLTKKEITNIMQQYGIACNQRCLNDDLFIAGLNDPFITARYDITQTPTLGEELWSFISDIETSIIIAYIAGRGLKTTKGLTDQDLSAIDQRCLALNLELDLQAFIAGYTDSTIKT